MRKPRCAATLGHRGCNDDVAEETEWAKVIKFAGIKPE